MQEAMETAPRLIDLIREWVKEDPILSKHFFFTSYKEGAFIETRCDTKWRQHDASLNFSGWSIVMVPARDNLERRVTVYYHDSGGETRVRGYLRKEDPQFFTKLREFLILGHDNLHSRTDCKIEWEPWETLPYRERADMQPWWVAGPDL